MLVISRIRFVWWNSQIYSQSLLERHKLIFLWQARHVWYVCSSLSGIHDFDIAYNVWSLISFYSPFGCNNFAWSIHSPINVLSCNKTNTTNNLIYKLINHQNSWNNIHFLTLTDCDGRASALAQAAETWIHQYWEGNMAADWVSDRGKMGFSDFIDYAKDHPDLQRILLMDVRGYNIPDGC